MPVPEKSGNGHENANAQMRKDEKREKIVQIANLAKSAVPWIALKLGEAFLSTIGAVIGGAVAAYVLRYIAGP
jgi:hypothetical protein